MSSSPSSDDSSDSKSSLSPPPSSSSSLSPVALELQKILLKQISSRLASVDVISTIISDPILGSALNEAITSAVQAVLIEVPHLLAEELIICEDACTSKCPSFLSKICSCFVSLFLCRKSSAAKAKTS